jgi:penicillin-binding protein 2
MREKIVHMSIISVFVFLSFSLLNSQLIHWKVYKQLSDRNCIRLLPQNGARGRILDANGNTIVGSLMAYDVVVLPQELRQLDSTLTGLSKIIDISPFELKDRFRKNFISSSIPVTVVRNVSFDKAVSLEEAKLDLDGVIIQPSTVRSYPFGRLASHVTGYLGEIDRWRLTKLGDYGYKTKDIVGFGGMEEKYDYYLRQEDGGLSVEVDHRGRFVRVLGFKPPKSGKDLQLTLDLNIQKIAEECLRDKKGAVIVMDADTGEIKALASFPDFDPSVFVRKSTGTISGLFGDMDSPMLNRAITGLYPAGSVFKVVVASSALESGKIKPNSTFPCTGAISVGGREFRCSNTHGEQNLFQAIAHSCNVFFYKTGILAGPQLLHDYALRLGLGRPTLIELPYESSGHVPNPLWKKIYKFQNWYKGDTVNFSIGQGELLVTPLQLCRMMAVFANRGKLLTPYLVKAIDGKDVSQHHRRISEVHFKDSTINSIRKGLREAVSDETGTARILSDLKVSVAGKTGTAQASGGQPHGWFVGFFPFERPSYVIAVFMERGGSGYVSCVVARQIIDSMVQQGLI